MASSGSEPISVPSRRPRREIPRAGGSRTDEDEDRIKPEVTVSVSTPRLAPTRGSRAAATPRRSCSSRRASRARGVWTGPEEVVFDLAATRPERAWWRRRAPRESSTRCLPDGAALLAHLRREAGHVRRRARRRHSTPRRALYRRRPGGLRRRVRFARQGHGPDQPVRRVPLGGRGASGSRVEFAFRSGESATPDATWSAWSNWEDGSDRSLPDRGARRALPAVEAAGGDGWRTRVPRSAGPRRPTAIATPRRWSTASRPWSRRRSWRGRARADRTSSRARAPDEKGIFTSLEEPKSDSSPRKLFRKGYRTRAVEGDRSGLRHAPLRHRVPAGRRNEVARAPKTDVRETLLFLRRDVASRRRLRLPA